MKKILIFLSFIFITNLSFCLTKEELVKKINAYAAQIINKELASWKTNPETKKPIYDLSSLKNNTRIFLFEPMLLSIRKYVNEGNQQPLEEPILDLSKDLLNLVTNRINNIGTPLDSDMNKANEVIDKLQYSDMNTDNFDKQEVLEHLRRTIVEIANYVFSLSAPTTDAEKYIILKDDIKSLKNDIDALEEFFLKNKKSILLEEFSDEAESNWSYIKEKITDITTQSKSDQLPKYVNDVKDLGDKILEVLRKNTLSEDPKSEDKASLMQNVKQALNPLLAQLSNNANIIKNLKIISLAKIQAQDILIYLTSKLVSIINIIDSPDIMKLTKSTKSEEPELTFEQINNDLTNYSKKLKQVPSLKIASMIDKNRATRFINDLKKLSSTTFIELMLYLAQHKDLEKLATNLKDLNHKLLENFEKYYTLRTIMRKAIIKNEIKENYDERLNIIKELEKFAKELEILKNTNNVAQKNKIISLFLTTANAFFSTINEFNKSYPVVNV